MLLVDYINQVGAQQLADDLDLDLSTIYKWRSYDSVPMPEHAYNIVRLTRGLVKYSDIYDSYFNRFAKNPNQLSFDLVSKK